MKQVISAACDTGYPKNPYVIDSPLFPKSCFFWDISVFTVGFLCNLDTVTKLEKYIVTSAISGIFDWIKKCTFSGFNPIDNKSFVISYTLPPKSGYYNNINKYNQQLNLVEKEQMC